MKDVTLVLTVQELDYILRSLGQRPFVEVTELVAKIISQANDQQNQGPVFPTP
jgi:hypothetical protein